MNRRPQLKVIKRYGVVGGNRFARIQFPDGTIKDVPTRKGVGGFEETRAKTLKAIAQLMRDGATVQIDLNGDYKVDL